MANAGTVNVNLKANTTAFHSSMEKAEGTLHKFHGTLETGKHILEAYLGYEAIAHVAEWVHHTIEAVEHQTKLADSLGISTEAMQALTYSTTLAGGSTEVLGAAMLKMEENLSGVGGSAQKTRDALAAMGMSMRDLQGKSGDEQFMAIADGLHHVSSSGDRAKIAVDLFGKAGAQLLPILSGGSEKLREQAKEAGELGILYSRIDAAKIEAANEALKKIGEISQGVLLTVTKELSPLISGIGDAFVEDAKKADAYGHTVHDVVETLITMVDGFRAEWAAVKFVIEGIALVLTTSWAAAFTEIDAEIRATMVMPFMLVKNAIHAVIETFRQLAGPEIGAIFKHVGAEIIQFYSGQVIEAANLMHKLGEMMVAAGVKGGTSFESASDLIRQSVSGIDVAAQRTLQSTQASMDKLKDIWKDVIPTWESTAIPGLSSLAAKLRTNVSLLWNDLAAKLNTPFEPHAFKEWASKVTEIAEEKAREEAHLHEQQVANDKAFTLARLEVDREFAERIVGGLNQQVLFENENYQKRIAELKKYHDEALLSDAEFQLAEKQAQTDHEVNLAGIHKTEAEKQAAWDKKTTADKLDAAGAMFGNLATLMNSHSRRAFEIGKLAAYAQAIVTTAAGIARQFADLPIYLAIPAAAAVAIAGGVQIASIASTHFDGGGSSGGGAVAGGSGAIAGASGTAYGPSASTTGGGTGNTAVPTLHINVEGLTDDMMLSGLWVRKFVDSINEAQTNGSPIEKVGSV